MVELLIAGRINSSVPKRVSNSWNATVREQYRNVIRIVTKINKKGIPCPKEEVGISKLIDQSYPACPLRGKNAVEAQRARRERVAGRV